MEVEAHTDGSDKNVVATEVTEVHGADRKGVTSGLRLKAAHTSYLSPTLSVEKISAMWRNFRLNTKIIHFSIKRYFFTEYFLSLIQGTFSSKSCKNSIA